MFEHNNKKKVSNAGQYSRISIWYCHFLEQYPAPVWVSWQIKQKTQWSFTYSYFHPCLEILAPRLLQRSPHSVVRLLSHPTLSSWLLGEKFAPTVVYLWHLFCLLLCRLDNLNEVWPNMISTCCISQHWWSWTNSILKPPYFGDLISSLFPICNDSVCLQILWCVIRDTHSRSSGFSPAVTLC